MGADEKHAATYHGGEYTPTTAVVHSIYMTAWNSTVDPVDQQEVQDKARDEFTRWLETVRAEAKAEAWDEAVKWYIEKIACPRTCGDCAYCREDDTYNPYKENQS